MGRYEGSLTTTWTADGRSMQLADRFTFVDRNELRWNVPSGARIDGASIPQILWSITGSPYTGKYRDASVVHDFYCSVRSRTSDATHRMFHEAMIVSGVSTQRAALMYAAVKYAGPRWSMMDIHNVNLATGGQYGSDRERASSTECDGWRDEGGYDGGGYGGGSVSGEGYGGGHAQDEYYQIAGDAWAPSNVSAEDFSQFAEDILAGKMNLASIEAQLGYRGMGSSAALPGGLFPFAADQASDIKPL